MADDQHNYKVGPGRKRGKTGRIIEQMPKLPGKSLAKRGRSGGIGLTGW